jgi:hypothetical protein
MGKRPESHSVGDYSKLEGMGLHHLPLHHHHRRVGGALTMGDPQHYLTSPAHQSTHWRNTAPMSYSHIVDGGRHRPRIRRTGGAISEAYRKELQDYVFDQIQRIRKPTPLDYFAFRPDYRQYVMERITPEIDRFLSGYYGLQLGLKTRFASSKIYTDLMDHIIPVLQSVWPTMADNEKANNSGMNDTGGEYQDMDDDDNDPRTDPNGIHRTRGGPITRPSGKSSGKGRHRPLLRKRRGGAIISGGVPSIETGFESPMSYAKISGGAVISGPAGVGTRDDYLYSLSKPVIWGKKKGGMINPMKPDGTMMTKKEIKMVQLRNKLINRPKRKGYDSDSGSSSDSDRELPRRRRRGGGMDLASMFAYGMKNKDEIADLTKLGMKLLTGKGRGKLGIGGKHPLHAHHQHYLAKHPTTKFKSLEAFAKKFGKGLGYCC